MSQDTARPAGRISAEGDSRGPITANNSDVADVDDISLTVDVGAASGAAVAEPTPGTASARKSTLPAWLLQSQDLLSKVQANIVRTKSGLSDLQKRVTSFHEAYEASEARWREVVAAAGQTATRLAVAQRLPSGSMHRLFTLLADSDRLSCAAVCTSWRAAMRGHTPWCAQLSLRHGIDWPPLPRHPTAGAEDEPFLAYWSLHHALAAALLVIDKFSASSGVAVLQEGLSALVVLLLNTANGATRAALDEHRVAAVLPRLLSQPSHMAVSLVCAAIANAAAGSGEWRRRLLEGGALRPLREHLSSPDAKVQPLPARAASLALANLLAPPPLAVATSLDVAAKPERESWRAAASSACALVLSWGGAGSGSAAGPEPQARCAAFVDAASTLAAARLDGPRQRQGERRGAAPAAASRWEVWYFFASGGARGREEVMLWLGAGGLVLGRGSDGRGAYALHGRSAPVPPAGADGQERDSVGPHAPRGEEQAAAALGLGAAFLREATAEAAVLGVERGACRFYKSYLHGTEGDSMPGDDAAPFKADSRTRHGDVAHMGHWCVPTASGDGAGMWGVWEVVSEDQGHRYKVERGGVFRMQQLAGAPLAHAELPGEPVSS